MVRTNLYNIGVGQTIEVFGKLPEIGSQDYLKFMDALYTSCEMLSVYLYGVKEADLNQQLTLRDVLEYRSSVGTVTLQFISGLTCQEAYLVADAQQRLTLFPTQTLNLDPNVCKYSKRASRLSESLVLSQHEAVSYGFADEVQLGMELKIQGLEEQSEFNDEEDEDGR